MFLLYNDEDRLDRGLLQAARAAGFDLVSATEAGMTGRPDHEHLELAASLARVLYSANVRDFSRIHAAWMAADRHHSGIILCPNYHLDIGEQVRRLQALGDVQTSETMRDNLEFLSAHPPAGG